MTLSQYLDECATRAALVLGHEIEVSVTVREHGISLKAGSSSRAAARCDQAEARADTGPCIAAMRVREALTTDVATAPARWEAWATAAKDAGFVQALGAPAVVGPGVQVALNVYSRTGGDWPADFVSTCTAYALLTADAVRLQLQFADLEAAVAALHRRIADDVAVERAVGVLMAANDCTDDDARRALRTASQARDLPLREVADSIVRSLVLGGEGDVIGGTDR